MTTEAVLVADAHDSQEQALSMPETAVRMAGYVATLMEHDRGGFAELRRMKPDAPDAPPPIFWKVLARYDQLNKGPDIESNWALILNGIAIMTPTQSEGPTSSAHNGQVSVGRALFVGDGERGVNGFYSETRLSRLLNARGPVLRSLFVRMFRMLGARGVTFNWREMARFILYESEMSRRRISSDYYGAHRDAERQARQDS